MRAARVPAADAGGGRFAGADPERRLGLPVRPAVERRRRLRRPATAQARGRGDDRDRPRRRLPARPLLSAGPGRRSSNVLPAPATLWTDTLPPWASAIAFTIARPRPDTAVPTVAARRPRGRSGRRRAGGRPRESRRRRRGRGSAGRRRLGDRADLDQPALRVCWTAFSTSASSASMSWSRSTATRARGSGAQPPVAVGRAPPALEQLVPARARGVDPLVRAGRRRVGRLAAAAAG